MPTPLFSDSEEMQVSVVIHTNAALHGSNTVLRGNKRLIHGEY